METIQDKLKVSIAYTLKERTGRILEEVPASHPFTYIHGFNNIIPGLEDALNALPNSEGATNFRTSKWKFFRWRRFVRYAKVGGKYLLAAKALRRCVVQISQARLQMAPDTRRL